MVQRKSPVNAPDIGDIRDVVMDTANVGTLPSA